MKPRQLAVLLALVVSSVSFAQTAGETVSLRLTSSSYCGPYGAEVARVDRGPEGANVPTNSPYVVPQGYRLEVTDLSYELLGFNDPGYAHSLSVQSKDRQSGTVFDSLFHKHNFDQTYRPDANGIYRADGSLSARWATYHVSFHSGLQVSARARVCVVLEGNANRISQVTLRGRLTPAPSSVLATTGTTTGTVTTK